MKKEQLLLQLNKSRIQIDANYMTEQVDGYKLEGKRLEDSIIAFMKETGVTEQIDLNSDSFVKRFINYTLEHKKVVEGKVNTQVLEDLFDETGKGFYKDMLSFRKNNDKLKKYANLSTSIKNGAISPVFKAKNNEKESIFSSSPALVFSGIELEGLFSTKSFYAESLTDITSIVDDMRMMDNVTFITAIGTTVYYKGVEYKRFKERSNVGEFVFDSLNRTVIKNTLNPALFYALGRDESERVLRDVMVDIACEERKPYVCRLFLFDNGLHASLIVGDDDSSCYLRLETVKGEVVAMFFDKWIDLSKTYTKKYLSYSGTDKDGEAWEDSFGIDELYSIKRIEKVLYNFKQLKAYGERGDMFVWENLMELRKDLHETAKDRKDLSVIAYYYSARKKEEAYKMLGMTKEEGEQIRNRFIAELKEMYVPAHFKK